MEYSLKVFCEQEAVVLGRPEGLDDYAEAVPTGRWYIKEVNGYTTMYVECEVEVSYADIEKSQGWIFTSYKWVTKTRKEVRFFHEEDLTLTITYDIVDCNSKDS